jgi:hypothetical protein
VTAAAGPGRQGRGRPLSRRRALGLAAATGALGLSGCAVLPRDRAAPGILWQGGLPVAIAAFGDQVAIADTYRNEILLFAEGREVFRVQGQSNGFLSNSGAGSGVLLFSPDGRELAWVERTNDRGVLRILDIATREVRNHDLELTMPPAARVLLWQNGYTTIAQLGERRHVDRNGRLTRPPALPWLGVLAVVDGAEWLLFEESGRVALLGPGAEAPVLLPFGRRPLNAVGQAGLLAIQTPPTMEDHARGRAGLVHVIRLDAPSEPAVATLEFNPSRERAAQLAWTSTHLLVRLVGGELRGYRIADWRLDWTIDPGAPGGANFAVGDGVVYLTTTHSVRRFPLPPG